jgi:hypothetical protein
MAKFKCKHTGNEVEFTQEYDIEEMRRHPEYEEVTEEVKTETKKQKQ